MFATFAIRFKAECTKAHRENNVLEPMSRHPARNLISHPAYRHAGQDRQTRRRGKAASILIPRPHLSTNCNRTLMQMWCMRFQQPRQFCQLQQSQQLLVRSQLQHKSGQNTPQPTQNSHTAHTKPRPHGPRISITSKRESTPRQITPCKNAT